MQILLEIILNVEHQTELFVSTTLKQDPLSKNCALGELMPLFIAVHKWKSEQQIAITKEAVALFSIPKEKYPEGVELCATYDNQETPGAFCVWQSPSKEVLWKIFDQYAPILKNGTELISVIQSVPPTIEHTIALYKDMIKASG